MNKKRPPADAGGLFISSRAYVRGWIKVAAKLRLRQFHYPR